MGEERPNRAEVMRESFAQLCDLRTVSAFARSFYGLLCRWLDEAADGQDEMLTAFALLLRIELRHHEALGKIADRESVDVAALTHLIRRTREMFGRLLRAIHHIAPGNPRVEMIRQLLLAECYYHLGKPGQVVTKLREARGLGCKHPIISFALGYNLYCGAVQKFVHLDGETSRFVVDRAAEFRGLLQEAINAFREGLAGDPFDADLYWWIGLLSEIICERADARAAYGRAMGLNPGQFAGPGRDKMRKLAGKVLDATSPGESKRLRRLPEITDADVEKMRRQVAEMDGFPDEFGDD